MSRAGYSGAYRRSSERGEGVHSGRDVGRRPAFAGGPQVLCTEGSRGLVRKAGVPLEPLLHGAGHEGGLRAGTENTPYLVGLGKAAQLAHKALDQSRHKLAALRDRLLDRLREVIGEQLRVHGEAAERLPNTLLVNFPRVSGPQLLSRIPELCASTGSACHSGVTRLSPTLAAMGLTPEGPRHDPLDCRVVTSEDEIDSVAELLLDAWENLCGRPNLSLPSLKSFSSFRNCEAARLVKPSSIPRHIHQQPRRSGPRSEKRQRLKHLQEVGAPTPSAQ